eukprot:797345-Pyramimonas_sp.AAC.1
MRSEQGALEEAHGDPRGGESATQVRAADCEAAGKGIVTRGNACIAPGGSRRDATSADPGGNAASAER